MKIITEKIILVELKKIAQELFGDMEAINKLIIK